MMRRWRYFRNLVIYYLSLGLMLAAAARALRQPAYWIATAALLLIHQAVRRAFTDTHPWRRIHIQGQDLHGFRSISYQSNDGLTLSGMFAPSRNQATLVLVHGLGGSGKDLALLARLLMRAGFGVLLVDLRAHGNSQGDTCTHGVKEAGDLACAIDYLLSRIDVNGEKIGAYGFSLGAQVALRGALKTGRIKALVLEGLGPARLSDHGGLPRSLQRWVNLPFNWLYYVFFGFMSGGMQTGVLQVIEEISPRPLLLIASGEKDIYFGRLFYETAKEPKEIWELPDAAHGGAIAQDPNQYMDRLIGFFSQSLNVQGGIR
jgi:pimeloyl-ACP methyl ester carboxylesterase